MKIPDIWVMSWYFMRHGLCFLFSPSVHCLRQSRASGCRLSRFAEASVSGVRPHVHCGSLRLRGLAGPACWHSLAHHVVAVTEQRRRYTVSAGFSWPGQWRSNTVSPVIMAITRTPWPPASLMPHGDSDKWTLVWSPPDWQRSHCALSEKDQASKSFVYPFIPMVTPEPWAGHIMAELGKCWAYTLLITHMQPLTVMDRVS